MTSGHGWTRAQQALDAVLDPSPDVAALGLSALAPLCQADVLDFYK
ncbi:hypothetical protein HaLaN_19643, partial [Haematococcus lacustris]